MISTLILTFQQINGISAFEVEYETDTLNTIYGSISNFYEIHKMKIPSK